MDKQTQQIEDARRKREDELTLLLLLLIGHAAEPNDITPDTFIAALTLMLLTIGAAEIAHSMALIHTDAFNLYADNLEQPSIEYLVTKYRPAADLAAQAVLDSLKQAMTVTPISTTGTTPLTLAGLLKSAGYTPANPETLQTGVELNIVAAGNAGAIASAIAMNDSQKNKPGLAKIMALRHVSTLDNRTTIICTERNGLTLEFNDPYWSTNCPPLHFRCRSVLYPLMVDRLSTNLPKMPPADGFGGTPINL